VPIVVIDFRRSGSGSEVGSEGLSATSKSRSGMIVCLQGAAAFNLVIGRVVRGRDYRACTGSPANIHSYKLEKVFVSVILTDDITLSACPRYMAAGLMDLKIVSGLAAR
jgi:hypothetical protein